MTQRHLSVVQARGEAALVPERTFAAPAPPALGQKSCTHSLRPRNVYWETTIACGLACKHCRAEAISRRDPEELTGDDARRLIDSIAELGSMLILTGGDPMERPDLFELIDYARGLHVPVGITPSTTPRLTRDLVMRFRDHGVSAMGVSLDGAEPATHDAFRGFAGTFAQARRVLDWAGEAKIPVQVNTTVTGSNIEELKAMYALLAEHHAPPVKRWSLFLLIPTGRAKMSDLPTTAEMEDIYGWLYGMGRNSPFHVGTVEAPMYRRYFVQRRLEEGASWEELLAHSARFGLGIRDGNGVVFVSHKGQVLPSGFVPSTPLGNVKNDSLTSIYRDSAELRTLRDMDQLGGKCGRCEFRWVCGGSRARAAAVTGNMMAEEPLCGYEPGRSSE